MLTAAERQAQFPSLENMTYLNTAAEGIPSLLVRDAFAQYFRDKQLGMDGRPLHAQQWEAAKELIAAMFGMTAEEVGICSCSSEAFNLAAGALRLKEGDEVIINDLDFPAGATPWLIPECPAKAVLWRSKQGVLDLNDLAKLLSARTRLVAVSLVSFFNGFKFYLPALAEVIRRNSPALLSVDVTQALGRVELVQELASADLIISSTHKWILATHGGGLVGVPHRLADQWTACAGGWFNLKDAFGPRRFEEAVHQKGAASFTVGMPNYPVVYAIRAALDYISRVGVRRIEAHADPLVSQCLVGLRRLPIELLSPTDHSSLAGILAFRHPDAERIHAHLHEKNIHVMHHAGRLRIALHGYNTQQDVETLLKELEIALKK